jgi:hypothetical protein
MTLSVSCAVEVNAALTRRPQNDECRSAASVKDWARAGDRQHKEFRNNNERRLTM